jgi:hypothetical protein
MNSERLRASRRKFLASLGLTSALPFLQTLPGYAQGQSTPKLILVFSGNGRIRHRWGADDTTGSLVFRENLAPLQSVAEHITLLEGIRNFAAAGIGGTHEGGIMSLFTGVGQGSVTGGPIGMPSIDQIFMAGVQGTARRDSLYQQVVAKLDPARNASPQNRIAFDASGNPRDPWRSGWEVMEQYLAGAIQPEDPDMAAEARRQRANEALFTSLQGQMSELMPKLCAEDRVQLEGMQQALAEAGRNMPRVMCDPPALPPKPTNLEPWDPVWQPPETTIDLSQSTHWYRERSRLAIDLLVASLACGVTRSGVLQYDQGASEAQAVGHPSHHHDTSHQVPQLVEYVEMLPVMPPDYKVEAIDHQANPTEQMRMTYDPHWDRLSQWERYYAEEFAYLVTKLQSVGILNDTIILWGSEIDDGQHKHYNMPFVIAAGPAIPIQRGKYVRYPISYDDQRVPSGMSRSHNDLLRTVLQAVGTTVPAVGTASHNQSLLTELLA